MGLTQYGKIIIPGFETGGGGCIPGVGEIAIKLASADAIDHNEKVKIVLTVNDEFVEAMLPHAYAPIDKMVEARKKAQAMRKGIVIGQKYKNKNVCTHQDRSDGSSSDDSTGCLEKETGC